MTIEQEHPALRTYIHTGGNFHYREASSYHMADHSAGIVISPNSPDIEVPPGSSVILERLMHLAAEGIVHYLTRNGEQIAGVGPAALVQAALLWPGDLDDGADESQIQLITDPSRLAGPGVSDFDSWFAAVLTDRNQP